MRLSDPGPCCRRPSLPWWTTSGASWGQGEEGSIAFLLYKRRGSRDILMFMSSLRTTKGATARLDFTILSVPVSKVHWRTSIVSFSNTLLVLYWLPVKISLLVKLNWRRLSAAAEIPWESSYFFFRSRAACALRLVLDINHLFLTLFARLWYAHSSGSKANKPYWKPKWSLHPFQPSCLFQCYEWCLHSF